MKGITIFDFDGSVTAQYAFLRRFRHLRITRPMTLFQQSARLWCGERHFCKISQSMQLENINQFSLLGSGDYHHLTLALLQQHKLPLTLVLFDNHPDWMRPPYKYHCGSWVYTAARLPQIERIVIIGLENGDLYGKKFQDGDVESFASKKIILLPYIATESVISTQQTVKLQSHLKLSLKLGMQEILDAITTQCVYISVDKDCLKAEDAITNWEQGTLPLNTIISCIQAIREVHNVVGADTVGDYSKPIFISPLKWIGSLLDRPANALRMNSQTKADEVNATANIKLAVALGLT